MFPSSSSLILILPFACIVITLRVIVAQQFSAAIVKPTNDICPPIRAILAFNPASSFGAEQDLNSFAVCDSSAGCCSLSDQINLERRSREKYVSTLKESLTGHVYEPFMRRVRQLNDQLAAGLKRSAIDLHQLFRQTYGLTYDQNAPLFAQLFKDLQSNYNQASFAPDVIVHRFFRRLFIRIFRVFNAQRSFTDEYDECLAEQMQSLRPFGKHPDMLASSLKRSLGALQTFVNGMKSANFVLAELIQEANASSICGRDLLRAGDCALCTGHVGVRTCFGSCVQVMQQCLAEYSHLEPDWNLFIAAMRRLVVKLDGALSVPAAIDPIAIRVSEAIMHFQENGYDLTQRVFAVCGKMSSLFKREAHSDRFKRQSSSDLRPAYPIRSVTYSAGRWKQLFGEIKNDLSALRHYWSRLPRNLCSDEQLVNPRKDWQTDPVLSKQCWNASQLIDVQTEQIAGDHKKAVLRHVPRRLEQKRTVLRVVAERLKQLTDRNLASASSNAGSSTTAASRRRSETNHHPRLDPQLEHESDQDDYEEEEEEPKTADEEEQVLYSDTELDQDTSPDEIGPENPDLTNRLLTDTSDDSGTAVRLNGQSTNDANLREEDKSDNSRDDHDEKEHVIELTSNTDVKRVIENELKRFDSTAIHLTSNHNSAFTLTINRVWITAIACLVCFI